MKQLLLLILIILNVQVYSQEKREFHGDVNYKNIIEIKGLIYTKSDTSLVSGRIIRYNRKEEAKRYIFVKDGIADINGWVDLNDNFNVTMESELGEVLKLGVAVTGLAMAISGNDIDVPIPNNPNGYNNENTRGYLDYINSTVEKSFKEASERNDVTKNLNSQLRNDSNSNEEYDKDGEVLNREAIIDNKHNGYWQAYYPNDKLKNSGSFKNGKEEGLWEEYYENGKLRSLGNYSEGIKKGLWQEYHSNGQLENKVNFVSGKKEGLMESFYNDGHLQGRINYKDGRENGLMEAYHSNSQLMMIGIFKNAKQIGEWKYYDENGKLIKTENHQN